VSSRGRFISLEGGEGVGKSTQVRALAAALDDRGLRCLVTREPGGSGGAEAIRDLLLSGDEQRWSAPAEALLFAAARADHLEKIISPALGEGRWVISDRFVDSSMAYQGGAGGLAIQRIRPLHEFGSGGLMPDRTLVLLLDDGQDRALARDKDEIDRIGMRSRDYHHKVDLAFRMIAAEEPERVRLINASGSPEQVTQRLLDAIADLLP
jgi:dTMP kinase